jgi:hypothetical protein
VSLTMRFPTVTITSGQATSAELDCGDETLVGVILPSTFDGTALTFSVSATSGGTYYSLCSGGAALSITVAASQYVALDPSIFAGVRFVKFTSGTAQSGTDTILVAVVRPVI